MADDLTILAFTAAAIGVVHTLIGPDHYLPFIVLGRARRWSLARTSAITLVCGLGHVAGSLVLGLVGVALGVAVSRLEMIEARRGDLAAWLLITVGVVYGAWGLHRALRGRGHRHLHRLDRRVRTHAQESHHHHHHGGEDRRDAGHLPADLRDADHLRAHAEAAAERPSITPWVLFVVFALGPCEPLIPLLMYPAATAGLAGAAMVAAVFAAATLAAMLAAVALGTLGVGLLPIGPIERYSHALAGAAIAMSGVGIELLGL